MTGLGILDLVIGLFFVYFLLSLICSTLQEMRARIGNLRSENLSKWIKDTFNDGVDGDRNSAVVFLQNWLQKPERGLFFKTVIPWALNSIKKAPVAANQKEMGFGDRLLKNVIIDGLTQTGRSAAYLTKEVFTRALLEEVHKTANESRVKSRAEVASKSAEDAKASAKGNATAEVIAAEAAAAKAKAEVGALTSVPLGAYTFHSLADSINDSAVLPVKMKTSLLQIHSESFQNIDHFKEKIGIWFDQAMERNAGAFKKSAQAGILWFSIAVTVFLNVDSIKLIRYFYNNPSATTEIADAADRITKDKEMIDRMARTSSTAALDAEIGAMKQDIEEIKKYKEQLASLKLPIGWDNEKVAWTCLWDILAHFFGTAAGWTTIFGWTITALAVSLGAPFWFDTLNKLVDLRSAGKKPATQAAQTVTTSEDENAVG